MKEVKSMGYSHTVVHLYLNNASEIAIKSIESKKNFEQMLQ